ncbi:prepilin peptidase [Actinotalea ferrariae]|uniref:prepilin peptidase n=1 Tax=Actinotalea ferrariae TaxID=1386098 RepID=UPI001C8CD85D|nr:A24 family peptidase [Actinotalea ferrariae]MBX9245860.1 prepilin peptidase [Actinotalea ferrariae]
MTAVLLALLGVLGLAVGSFLNVVIHRVPAGLSVVRPASACPACGKPVRPRDNVPVLSWLVLRGRCRDCGEPISVRYLVVELVTAAAFVGVGLRFLVLEDAPGALPAFAYLAAIGVALAAIDLDVHRLPNAIVLPSYPVLAVLLAVACWAGDDWSAGLRAVIGGVGLYALYFLLVVVKPGGMGFGDVKLAGLLGAALAWCGWGTLAVGAFGAFLVGGVYAVVLVLAGRAGKGSRIPFGPWMIAGAALGVAVGEPLWRAYLDLLV